MRFSTVVSAAFATALALRPVVVSAQSSPVNQDIGAEVRAVFAAKCAACHGSDLTKPKGRFGYVLDLARVAKNPEMVIPYQPGESELWLLVERDEMPPPDSPRGPLTSEQKQTIREWIASGAPDTLPGAADSPTAVRPEGPTVVSSEPAAANWLIGSLGKFHLVLLHFPTALVLAAGVNEAWSVWLRKPRPSGLVRCCLWLGALTMVSAVGLGWMFAPAGTGAGSPQLLTIRRWLGISTSVWITLTALGSEHDARRRARSGRVRLLLTGGVLLTVTTAYFGGLPALGEDFFSS